MSDLVADLVAIHARFAKPSELVLERRSLYRLAAELVGVPGVVPDGVLDSPPVRYELGGALAGRIDLTGADLEAVQGAIGRVVHAGLPVVADSAAHVALADLLRIVEPVQGLRLLTADDQGFDQVLDIIDGGVRLLLATCEKLAADLLAHVSLIVVVDPDTAGGLVSASSRYFPGAVVIARPASVLEVAEALIHEGAHEKFFDLAITRSFFGMSADSCEHFIPSWVGVKWPLEQAYAAWHAYHCLAQWKRESTVELGGDSLVFMATERAGEIGSWLIGHEASLLTDARWMLRKVEGKSSEVEIDAYSLRDVSVEGLFSIDPLLRWSEPLPTGRSVVGRMGGPPDIYWLDGDCATVLNLFSGHFDGLLMEDVFRVAVELWDDEGDVRKRFLLIFHQLLEYRILTPLASV